MSDPLVTATDLGVLLSDPTINQSRAEYLLDRAQTLCESIISPLPDAAAVIVERVAARAYVTMTAARQVQLEMADAAYGTQTGSVGGVYLTDADRADLRRLSGGGGAFNIDLLPAGYTVPVADFAVLDASWDVNP